MKNTRFPHSQEEYMHVSRLLRATLPPAIVELQDRQRGTPPGRSPVLNLGQAVPDLTPPASCLSVLQERLAERATHLYTPDRGLETLRQAVADDCRRRLGVDLDPEEEILITGGANHAFFLAVLALLEPGQKLLLPSPWYFNHAMALQLLGMEPLPWPMAVKDETFELDLDSLPRLLAQASGVVCINPNNPTGAVFPPAQMETLVQACRSENRPLIYDEVYRLLAFGDRPPLHPFQIPGGREITVVTGSFSKLFGMTGWRVGYLIAPPALMREIIKAQDTTLICAPTAGQMLAAECLVREPDFPAAYRQSLAERVRHLRSAVKALPWMEWRDPGGALFTMVRLKGNEPSASVADRLYRESGIIAIPGSSFGEDGEGHVRLSFGFAGEEALMEMSGRLGDFRPPDGFRG